MLVALVAGTAASLAPAPLAKTAIDSGILKGDRGTLDLVVVAFVVSALVVWVATYAQTYLVGWVGQRALADLRLQIFRHLQEMPVGFYERRPAGMLISRMTNDVEALDSLVTDTVVTLFQATLTLVGSVVILLFLDAQLALLTFLIFPVMAIGSLAFRIASADAYRRTRETISAITAYLQETLSGIRVVRAFAQEPRHRARFAELNDVNRDANLVTVNLNAAYFPAVELVSAVATVGILVVGGRQAINGDIEIGVLVGFIAALNGFFDPIGQLSQVYTTYQSGMAALDKIFELLDVTPELTDRPDADHARAHPRRDPLRGRLLPLPHGGRPHPHEARARRPVARRAAGPDGGARRRHRRGQVDLRQARRALLRPHRRARARRRPRPARGGGAVAALADGHRAAGGVPLQRHDRRQHRLRAPERRAWTTSRPPRGRSARGTSSRRCPRASTPRSASAAFSSRPASASSWPSPGP